MFLKLLAQTDPTSSPFWLNILENQGLTAVIIIVGGRFVWNRLCAEETGYLSRIVDKHIGFIDSLDARQNQIKESLDNANAHAKNTCGTLDQIASRQSEIAEYLKIQCDSTLTLLKEKNAEVEMPEVPDVPLMKKEKEKNEV